MRHETPNNAMTNDWPPCGAATVYSYCFCVWPDTQCSRWNPSAFAVFQVMTSRVAMEFTERAFNDFREELAKVGLTLCEIERTPHFEPAPVH